MADKYLFDVAVYAFREDAFYDGLNEEKQKYLKNFEKHGLSESDENTKSLYQMAPHHFSQKYGAPWKFNQIVGWVRIYVLGEQLRGETWFVDAEKIQRVMKRRRLEFFGDAFELDCCPEDSSLEIFENLLAELKNLGCERPFKNRYLDLEMFCNIGPFVDWASLIDTDS